MVHNRLHAFCLLLTIFLLLSCEKEPLPILKSLTEEDNAEQIELLTPKRVFEMSAFNVELFSNNAQGMDIYNDRYMFQAGIEQNYIHIIDLQESKALGTISFTAPIGGKCHMNNINCGIKLSASDRFPLLYLSQTSWTRACFVLRISNDADSYEVIQTIQYLGKEHYPKNCSFDWFIDYSNNFIYTYGKYNGSVNKREIMKFHLPSLDSESVSFYDEDIIESFVLDNQSVYQGSRLIDGLLYTPVGSGNGTYPGKLLILDIEKKEVIKDIPLNCGEPEAIGKYKSGAIISSGGRNPNYYFIRLK